MPEGNIFGGKTPAETWFGTMVPLLADQPVLPLPGADPRFVEGGAESKVPTSSETMRTTPETC